MWTAFFIFLGVVGAMSFITCLFIIGCLVGMTFGKEMAVDSSASRGYFEAYGRKYKATLL